MEALSDLEFSQFQQFIFHEAGITLGSSKKALVCGRLSKRLHARRLGSYSEYLRLLKSGESPDEVRHAVDLLTTNETYFFREPKHFELLARLASREGREPLRVWSAACSSGEEVYSAAMVLDDQRGELPWDLLGSDISTRMLERARCGHYPLSRTTDIPQEYLKRYCLKGLRTQAGSLLVDRPLRRRVRFLQVNLDRPLPALGTFDVIFLRNVMLYFSNETASRVVRRLADKLARGGYLFIGHSENLYRCDVQLEQIAPAVFRKP